MAMNIQFAKKSSPGSAETFNDMDVFLRESLGQPMSDDEYLGHWYSAVAMAFAFGNSVEDMRSEINNTDRVHPMLPDVFEVLVDNYTWITWRD